jgi:formylglycine-generating enzyme required for sulfatase activity
MNALLLGSPLLVLALGCTSFSFPGKGGQGAAPAELKDTERMVKLAGGKFLMGWPQGEPDEYPVHEVELSAFAMDRTELTNAHYRACVDAKVCRASSTADDPELGRPSHPVVGVPWQDAQRYCAWVGKRLPTEAEWEYAARSPAFLAFPWQGRFSPTFANSRGELDGYAKTAPVGSYPAGASGKGLLDMAGNVAEWTSDWYEASYYQVSDTQNPTGPALATGNKSVRGGSWADTDFGLRATARDSLAHDFGKDSVGFRCVTARW